MIRKMSGLSTISYERVRLPKGEEWFLEFDDMGMGAAADAGNVAEGVVIVEDVLQRVVCRRGGRLWVVDKAANSEWCI